MRSGVQAEVIAYGRNCFSAGSELPYLKFACVYICNSNSIGFYIRPSIRHCSEKYCSACCPAFRTHHIHRYHRAGRHSL